MPLGDYTKTTWVNGSAPGISADRLNNEENKIKELDAWGNTHLADVTYQVATGTATAITVTTPTLVNGYAKTFIVSADNAGVATTINVKPLYKPNTTIAPNLTAGKAVTVWYNLAGDCFFIKVPIVEGIPVSDKLSLYVSPTGSDSNTGTSSGARLQTLARAIAICNASFASDVEVNLAPGSYAGTPLQYLKCSILQIKAESGTSDTFITSFFSVSYSYGVLIKLLRLNITGTYGIEGLNMPASVRLYGCIINAGSTGIAMTGTGLLSVDGTDITAMGYAIDLSYISTVEITGSSNLLQGGALACQFSACGAVYLSNITIECDSASGNYGVYVLNGTHMHFQGVKGSLDLAGVISCKGSIVHRGANTITGAADIKSEGGQIYV